MSNYPLLYYYPHTIIIHTVLLSTQYY